MSNSQQYPLNLCPDDDLADTLIYLYIWRSSTKTWGVHCTLRTSVHSRSFLAFNFPLHDATPFTVLFKSVMCRIILSSLHTTYQDGCLMYFHILCSYCDLFILVWNLCFWEPKASMLQIQRFDASLRYDTVLNTRSRGTDALLDWFTFLISLMSFVTQGLCAPLLLFTRLTSRSYHLRK